MIQKIYLTKIRSFVCYFHFYSLFSKKTKIFVFKIQNEREKMYFNFRRRLLLVRDGISKVVKQKNVFTFIWYSHDITWPSRKRDRKNRTQRGMSWDRLFFLSLKPPGVSFLIFVVFSVFFLALNRWTMEWDVVFVLHLVPSWCRKRSKMFFTFLLSSRVLLLLLLLMMWTSSKWWRVWEPIAIQGPRFTPMNGHVRFCFVIFVYDGLLRRFDPFAITHTHTKWGEECCGSSSSTNEVLCSVLYKALAQRERRLHQFCSCVE